MGRPAVRMPPLPVDEIQQWILVWRPHLDELLDAVESLPDEQPNAAGLTFSQRAPIPYVAAAKDAAAKMRAVRAG